jgi:hypothetical protein
MGLVSINGVNMGSADFRVYIKPIDRSGKQETSLINGPPNLGIRKDC